MQASNETNNSNSKLPFVLIENSNKQDRGDRSDARRPAWNFEISSPNKTISLTLQANHEDAYLSDLVPVTHQICDMINRLAVENETENGTEISCKKGCAECCSYMVSLSSAEAFYLRNYILSLPGEIRKPILHSFLRAARKIAANKIPPVNTNGMDEFESLKSISNWYQKLDIKCPFIEKNACSQYHARPLVCREHLVTSPPKACRPFSSMLTNIVELPFSTAEMLMDISNRIESTNDEAILLPLAMVWCNSNAQRGEKKHKTALLAEQLIKVISQKTPAIA